MNSPQNKNENVDLWRLTDEQRIQVYEEEKRRIKQNSPIFSKKTKIYISVYLLGCLLLYFGITNAAMDFWSTKKWNIQPEPDLFYSLFDAAILLIRPLLAVVLTFWTVAIPIGLVLGLWIWGTEIISFIKKVINRN